MARNSKRWTTLPSTTKTTNGEKIPTQLESETQKQVIKWAEAISYKGNPLTSYIHHPPNGGHRNLFEAIKFKLMGVRAGYPDLIIDIAQGGYHGMRVELKRDEKEKPRDNQILAMQLLSEEGYYVLVAKSFDHAIEKIHRYVKGLEVRQPN